MTVQDHLNDAQLAALVDGHCGPQERDQLLGHLDQCASCYELYREVSLSVVEELPGLASSPSRSWMGWLAVAAAAAAFATWWLQNDPDWANTATWEAHFSVNQNTEYQQADAVFRRLIEVTPGSQDARLVVLDDLIGPWSVAVDDGVLISSSAVRLCFQSATQAEGEGRLASVLGHELEHFMRGERFHAFAAQQTLEGAEPASIGRNLQSTDDFVAAELRADRFALFRCAAAGFQAPRSSDTAQSFIESWSEESIHRAAFAHVEPAQRALALQGTLDQAQRELVVYELALKSYLMGHGDVAHDAWTHVLKFFPSRDVYVNRGLASLQQAHVRLARCDGSLAMRFWLPGAPDTDALLNRVRYRGAQSIHCTEEAVFVKSIAAAREDFGAALELDPDSLIANRYMLVQAFLSGSQDLMALINPASEQPEDQMLAHMARFLFAQERQMVDSQNQSLDELMALQKAHSNHLALRYNVGRLLLDAGRTDQAAAIWTPLARIRGPFGQIVREWLGDPRYPIEETDVAFNSNIQPESLATIRTGSYFVRRDGDRLSHWFNDRALWIEQPAVMSNRDTEVYAISWNGAKWVVLASGQVLIDHSEQTMKLSPLPPAEDD